MEILIRSTHAARLTKVKVGLCPPVKRSSQLEEFQNTGMYGCRNAKQH